LIPFVSESSGFCCGITKKDVEQAWRYTPDISCVVITSPTYEGIVSDIKGIAEFLHEKGIPLIVDEAHGAHFKWSDKFPVSALESGADIIIQSLHKTLPALTPAALLHRGTDRIPQSKIEYFLQLYQTSSPSYVLMASIDQCIIWLRNEGKKAFSQFEKHSNAFYKHMRQMQYLYLYDCPDKDIAKIIIMTDRANTTGFELGKLLRTQYGVETEMQQPHYVMAITGAADTKESWLRLRTALMETDHGLSFKHKENRQCYLQEPEICYSSYEASLLDGEKINWMDSAGRTAKEFIYTYPPGIPCVVPGERITPETVEMLKELRDFGGVLRGLSDLHGEKIEVVKGEIYG
jgi:arginine/lysine/ornithine decarboxylase